VAAALRLGGEIGVEAAPGGGEGLQVGAEGQHVGVVVAPAVFGGVLAPGHHAAHAGHLVRRNRDAHAAAADRNAQRLRAGGDNAVADGRREVGIVDARRSAAAVVYAGVAGGGEVLDELLLELVSAVVAAEVYFHAFLPAVTSTSRLPMNTTISNAISRW
jgi:hypothetical protein